MKWHILLFLCFTFLGTVLSILFFFKRKGNRLANILLGIYTLLFSLELLNNSLRWSGDIKEPGLIHLNLLHFPFWTLYGALVFVHVRTVVRDSGLKLRDVLLLLPSFIIFLMIFPFYMLPTLEKTQIVNQGNIFEYAFFPPEAIWVVILVMFGFGILTYLTFWNNKNLGFREHVWLKWFVGSYFGYCFVFAGYIALIRLQWMSPEYDYLVDIAIVFFIALLTYFGFVQPEVFNGKSLRQTLPFVKYRKTGLSPALSLEMRQKLLDIMEREKPFLNHELRLDDIARLMNLSRNHTSQIINEHFNLTFFDFVNRYRIRVAKNLLLDRTQNKLTINQIAYDAGFNNRASFYKAFRKFTGANPSSYQKRSKAS